MYINIHIYVNSIHIHRHTYIDVRTHTHVSIKLSHIETDTTVKRHCVRIQQDIQCIQVYAILYITYTCTQTHAYTCYALSPCASIHLNWVSPRVQSHLISLYDYVMKTLSLCVSMSLCLCVPVSLCLCTH